jgi:Circadian oscillating protein COP23
LRYLTAGTWDKKAVICGVRKQGDNCGADYLFTIKPTDEPGLVAQQLMGLLTGDAGGVGVLTQSTGSVYIDLGQFLSTAPLEANR